LSAYRVLFLQNDEQGFHPLMDQYLQSWLHSDQLITLTNRTPHRSVPIFGITLDFACCILCRCAVESSLIYSLIGIAFM
jgi:hypothetical protein